MRILLLTHIFNGLSQRLFCALQTDGHALSVEFDISDSVTEEAVAMWRPEVVVAPFLKRRIPASVWQRVPCLVVHPGPPGDRGPAALDWAILDGAREWGVTVLQANDAYDAGPAWASQGFALRAATKSSLYRHEVTTAAVAAVREALSRGAPMAGTPPGGAGGLRPAPTAAQRAVHWAEMDRATALRHLRASDGHPGAPGVVAGRTARLFDAHPATPEAVAAAPDGAPGALVARRGPAVLCRTRDAAVWIGHLRAEGDAASGLKRPAVECLDEVARNLPELAVPLARDAVAAGGEVDELRYEEFGPPAARVGWLAFDFHNGAMSTRQCLRLRDALRGLRERPMRVLVLAGGSEFFSNGIHLHDIEAAAHRPGDSAADASMRNIEAMDDAVLEILTLTDRLTVSALRGNAGAGGVFLALAADHLWAHAGVVLNPHYKNMGNLYGSEYWTYTLPRRIGEDAARRLMQGRLPLDAQQAQALGLLDAVLAADAHGFEAQVRTEALAMALGENVHEAIERKRHRRMHDETIRPLADHRESELQHMRRNFYGFDPSYHVARHHFVHRKPMAWTPRHLALHRERR